jgi:hypothetical protein
MCMIDTMKIFDPQTSNYQEAWLVQLYPRQLEAFQ